jgi:hypothetical protein
MHMSQVVKGPARNRTLVVVVFSPMVGVIFCIVLWRQKYVVKTEGCGLAVRK